MRSDLPGARLSGLVASAPDGGLNTDYSQKHWEFERQQLPSFRQNSLALDLLGSFAGSLP
jgi:hypothetical protein